MWLYVIYTMLHFFHISLKFMQLMSYAGENRETGVQSVVLYCGYSNREVLWCQNTVPPLLLSAGELVYNFTLCGCLFVQDNELYIHVLYFYDIQS